MPGKITRKPLYGRLKERLVSQINTLSTGTRIPSVRMLMNEYGVSMTTVHRALNELKDEGYIDSHWGKGLFVAERTSPRIASMAAILDTIVFGSPELLRSKGGFHANLISRLGHLLGQKGGSMRTSMLPTDASLSAILERFEELQPQAVVLVNLCNPAVLEITNDRDIPAVLLLPDCYGRVPNSVLVDNRQSVNQTISHLYNLGHRNIACLHGVDDAHPHYVRDLNQRLQFFYEEMGGHGLRAEPALIHYGGWTQREGYQATKQILASGTSFSAMIINDHIAGGVYEALQENGLCIPKDISVVGHDDLSWCEYLNPPLTTIHVPREELARLCVERYQQLWNGQTISFDPVEVRTELIDRGSTGPAYYT